MKYFQKQQIKLPDVTGHVPPGDLLHGVAAPGDDEPAGEGGEGLVPGDVTR